MALNRIKRGVSYFLIVVAASLAGYFAKRVVFEDGTFFLTTMEIIQIAVSGVLVGILIPIIESRKKSRA